MRKNLTRANQLIHNIQNNLDNSKKLRDYCIQLQDLTQYIEPQTKYHYMLFLAEIYSSKLREFRIAQTICRQIIQDPRPAVQIQGTLRLSFIYALEHKYNYAIKNLQQADTLSDKKPQLQAVFIDFCHRLFLYSKQCNLLQGLKCEHQQQYAEAFNFYNMEFQSEVISGQIQNQYFAAKAIIQLTSIFQNQSFKGIDPKKCRDYLRQLYEEKGEHDDLTLTDKLDQNYKYQKTYLMKIVQLLKKKQASIKNTKSGRGGGNKFHKQLANKKLLAILKLQKIMKTEPKLNPSLRKEFQKCLDELKQNRIGNYSMLNEFTVVQNKTITRINEMIKRKIKQNGISILKTLIEQSQIPKEEKKIKNRFVNHPSFDTTSPLKGNRGSNNNSSKLSQLMPMKIVPTKSETISMQQQNIDGFQGSYMYKINQTSSGHQKRYFYFVKTQLEKGKLKLYYTSKKENTSSDDTYYELKQFVRIDEGKKSKALQRSECNEFNENLCFSIVFGQNQNKNFYVPDQKDYKKWMQVLKNFQAQKMMRLKTKQASKLNSMNSMKQTKMRQTVFY